MTANALRNLQHEVTSGLQKRFTYVSKSLKDDAKLPANNVILFDRREPMADQARDERKKLDWPTIMAVLALCVSTGAGVFSYVATIRDTTNASARDIVYLQADVKRLEGNQSQNQRDVREDLGHINDKLDRLLTYGTGPSPDQSASTKKWSRQ